MEHEIVKSNRIIATVLRWGSTLSIILMTAGLSLFLIKGSTGEEIRVLGLRQALAGAVGLEPVALMTLGILVLLVTPFLRVVAVFFSFMLIEKDFRYTLVSIGVLMVLAASLVIPGIKH